MFRLVADTLTLTQRGVFLYAFSLILPWAYAVSPTTRGWKSHLMTWVIAFVGGGISLAIVLSVIPSTVFSFGLVWGATMNLLWREIDLRGVREVEENTDQLERSVHLQNVRA